MTHFSGPAVLLDIEGTTSSVSYVFDVMFPYVRRELIRSLEQHWTSPQLVAACDLIAQQAGWDCGGSWRSQQDDALARQRVRDEVLRLMDIDSKTTGLKQLQGVIWLAGFESGELQAHVYDDVPAALAAWNELGIDVRIYSSGSVMAQRLFFRNTIYGDLLPYFRGHYDTTVGSKKDANSYRRIASDMGLAASEILFLSDVTDELDAARAAGCQTTLCLRPGNAPPPPHHTHPVVNSFAEVRIGTGAANSRRETRTGQKE